MHPLRLNFSSLNAQQGLNPKHHKAQSDHSVNQRLQQDTLSFSPKAVRFGASSQYTPTDANRAFLKALFVDKNFGAYQAALTQGASLNIGSLAIYAHMQNKDLLPKQLFGGKSQPSHQDNALGVLSGSRENSSYWSGNTREAFLTDIINHHSHIDGPSTDQSISLTELNPYPESFLCNLNLFMAAAKTGDLEAVKLMIAKDEQLSSESSLLARRNENQQIDEMDMSRRKKLAWSALDYALNEAKFNIANTIIKAIHESNKLTTQEKFELLHDSYQLLRTKQNFNNNLFGANYSDYSDKFDPLVKQLRQGYQN